MAEIRNLNYLKTVFYFIFFICGIDRIDLAAALPQPAPISYFDIDLNDYLKTVVNDGFKCRVGIFSRFKENLTEFQLKTQNAPTNFGYDDSLKTA